MVKLKRDIYQLMMDYLSVPNTKNRSDDEQEVVETLRNVVRNKTSKYTNKKELTVVEKTVRLKRSNLIQWTAEQFSQDVPVIAETDKKLLVYIHSENRLLMVLKSSVYGPGERSFGRTTKFIKKYLPMF